MPSLRQLKNHRMVEDVYDERGSGSGIMVYLKNGYATDPRGESSDEEGCHMFSEDTIQECFETLKQVQPCQCKACRENEVQWN